MTNKSCTFMILFLACFSPALGQGQTRLDSLIDDGWEFTLSYGSGRSRTERTVVNLPHTWNTAEIRNNKSDYYRGIGSYRKQLFIDRALSSKRIFLKFEAVSLVAQVFVNDKFVGEHNGAYTAFCFEITPFVEYGKENIIQVRASNAWRSDVMPLSGDFNIYGGIYRPVHLLITDQTCISPLDFASTGVYLTQSDVSEKSARLEVRILVSNEDKTTRDVGLRTTITDKNGRPIADVTTPVKAEMHATIPTTQDLVIEKPHLWDGREDPYLYRVVVQLISEGKILDEIAQPAGFRFFRTDPQKGFVLNGKYLDLHGVSRHQDRMGRGNALLVSDHQEDVSLMLEMGVNIVRLAHYPQSQEFINLCDSSGMIVWSEIPFVNLYSTSPAFEANGEQQLNEMVHQLYNHPSIVFWGLFNELRLKQDDPSRYLAHLQEIVKSIDKQRITTAATNLNAPFDTISDVIAWNRYFGWYSDSIQTIATWFDSVHTANPRRCIGLSEYGAGASVAMHEEDFSRTVEPRGEWHPEEWQSHFHERYWDILSKRPFVWCKIIWNMFDFASATRTEGDIDGRNDKGLITYDHKTRKDAFWFYKANWTDDPVVHITGTSFRVRERNPIDVKVYSNLEKLELLINGRSVGSVRGNAIRVFEWNDVKLRPGNNVVLVKGSKGGQSYTDSCIWWSSN